MRGLAELIDSSYFASMTGPYFIQALRHALEIHGLRFLNIDFCRGRWMVFFDDFREAYEVTVRPANDSEEAIFSSAVEDEILLKATRAAGVKLKWKVKTVPRGEAVLKRLACHARQVNDRLRELNRRVGVLERRREA